MEPRHAALLLTWVALAASGCSGKTSSSNGTGGSGGAGGSAASGGSGGTTQTGGAGGDDGGPCPTDLEVRVGAAQCQAVAPGCTTGVCVHARGAWMCAPPCPCAAGSACAGLAGIDACVPAALAACFDRPDGGTGGTGTGGTGGTGGTAGSGGTGGSAGSGGSGPCSGDPACYGTEASFCSNDGARLLSCAPADACPTSTSCTALCPACVCHMAPPVNGVLRGACDTCTSDGECANGLKCRENPMFVGSGAKTCVMP